VKGLDRFKVVFIDAHITLECAVCNFTSDVFPATDELIFECQKCNRYFKLVYAVRPMTQDEIEKHTKLKAEAKSNRISFNDLPAE